MRVQENVLTIEEKPDWVRLGIILITLWGMFLLIALKTWEFALFFGLLLLGLTGYLLYSTRTIYCVIDKNMNQVTYETIGLIGGRRNRKRGTYRLTDIRLVQVKRHIQRGGDQFECRLLMQGNETLPISQPITSIQTSEWFAKKVHEFLALERPVQFVD